jgi:biopolymer transport protein ExbB
MFDSLSESIINTFTYLINTYSGVMQVTVYFIMLCVFGFALFKSFFAICALANFDFKNIRNRKQLHNLPASLRTPVMVIAASFFDKTKQHYLEESQKNPAAEKLIPPDAFIRDAAFQFSERYFDEKFLYPISMMANLMPPLGFIGTIIGMVVHFLSNSGTLKSDLAIAGIATALYTTFIGLVCFTVLEFLKKIFHGLMHKRIDQGLTAVSDFTEN